MIDFEAKMVEKAEEALREIEVGYRLDAIMAFGRECAAMAFEEAAKIVDQWHLDGRCGEAQRCVCNVGPARLQIRDKAAALKSVGAEEKSRL